MRDLLDLKPEDLAKESSTFDKNSVYNYVAFVKLNKAILKDKNKDTKVAAEFKRLSELPVVIKAVERRAGEPKTQN